jgi:hypothetical protein
LTELKLPQQRNNDKYRKEGYVIVHPIIRNEEEEEVMLLTEIFMVFLCPS